MSESEYFISVCIEGLKGMWGDNIYRLIEVNNYTEIENIEFSISEIQIKISGLDDPLDIYWNSKLSDLEKGRVFLKCSVDFNDGIDYIFCKYGECKYTYLSYYDQYVIRDKLTQFVSEQCKDRHITRYCIWYDNKRIDYMYDGHGKLTDDISLEDMIKFAIYKCNKKLYCIEHTTDVDEEKYTDVDEETYIDVDEEKYIDKEKYKLENKIDYLKKILSL